jgi:hypothetical protein
MSSTPFTLFLSFYVHESFLPVKSRICLASFPTPKRGQFVSFSAVDPDPDSMVSLDPYPDPDNNFIS